MEESNGRRTEKMSEEKIPAKPQPPSKTIKEGIEKKGGLNPPPNTPPPAPPKGQGGKK